MFTHVNSNIVLKCQDLGHSMTAGYKLAERVASLKKEIVFIIAFVVLNVLDAHLTSTAIALGSSEMNPVVAGFGSSILFKVLISVAIVMALLLLKREKLLKPLTIGMLCVVLWNIVAVWSWS